MNICGVLVHGNPRKVPAILTALDALDGVEVHATAEMGRIVVTVEDTARTTAIDTIGAIHRLDGIVAASLIYHHFDPEHEAAQADLPGGSS